MMSTNYVWAGKESKSRKWGNWCDRYDSSVEMSLSIHVLWWAWLNQRYHGLVEVETILNIFRVSMMSFGRGGRKEVESWDVGPV